MHEYDVNDYLKKKRKKQQLKDKLLIASLIVSVVLCGLSMMALDSVSWVPTIVCGCSLLYIAAFLYVNTRGDE